jgi:hypothetical protein
MGVLDSDVFITELSKLFMSNRENGSVYITMKAGASLVNAFIQNFSKLILVPLSLIYMVTCSFAVTTTEDGKVVVGKVDPKGPPTETRCLIRATDGSSGRNKMKLSTIVRFSIFRFQMFALPVFLNDDASRRFR